MSRFKIKQIFVLLLFSMLVVSVASDIGCSSAPDWTAEKDITRIPLDWALNNEKPTLADFGWRDCIPCKKMKIVLENLASKYRGKLNVVIVEAYNHPDLMDRYTIDAIPVQVLFDGHGQEFIRHEGFWPEEDIQAELIKVGIN